MKGSLLRLVAGVALAVALAWLLHGLAVLVVVVALVVVVMLHELGHLVSAKWSGMKVTEYFLGFGPRVWSIVRGETEYGVKALPLGGYVRILGMSSLEDVDPSEEARAYRSKSPARRVLVAAAGSFVHFVLAFVLIYVGLVAVGVEGVSTRVAGFVSIPGHGDPARRAGIRTGDVVEAVDGQRVTDAAMLEAAVERHAGQRIVLEVREPNGVRRFVSVVPVEAELEGTKRALIGIELAPGPVLRRSPAAAFGAATVDFARAVRATAVGLAEVLSPDGLARLARDVTSPTAARQAALSGTRPESIVGAVRTAAQGVQAGLGDFLEVLVSINLFVGLINLLPMLPLDGGHVAVALYEGLRTRRGRRYVADVRKLAPVAYAFVVVLGFLFLSSLYLDVAHPVANPFR